MFMEFDNYFARNVVFASVGTISSSQSDNRKNNFSILGEGPTYGINLSLASPDKIFSINFTKTNTKFCLSLLLIIVICLLVEKSLWI